MTVCIAAACDEGQRIVTATDGLLSQGDITADTLLAKMLWLGEWQVMYAGTPANTALIINEIHKLLDDDPERRSARRIQETVGTAYRKFIARASSFDVLSPFDMTIDEFKKDGLQVFGSETHRELANHIHANSQKISEQLLVTGWGHSTNSAMLYEIGPFGEFLHSYAGFAVIGSGAQIAQSNLLLLGQSRHRTLSNTIFNVAVAKFSSEKSTGLDVGQKTAIWVSRKKADGDPHEFFAESLSDEEIKSLRDLWEQYVKPKLPDEAREVINNISRRLAGTVPLSDMLEQINALNRMDEKTMASASQMARDQKPVVTPSTSQTSTDQL